VEREAVSLAGQQGDVAGLSGERRTAGAGNLSVLPLEYRGRVVKNDNFALRIARSVKEDAEAIQAVVLKAPQHERLKEISESIVAKFCLDGPDSVAPLMAMVTTMLGAI
jgi:hypothetical protein